MFRQFKFNNIKGKNYFLDIYFYWQSWGIGIAIWPKNIIITFLCFEIDFYWGKSKF